MAKSYWNNLESQWIISKQRMSESSEGAATTDGELVSPEGTQGGQSACHLAATLPQPLPMVSPEGTQGGQSACHLAATWPQPLPMVSPEGTQDVETQDAGEVPIKGVTSVSPDSCIFPYTEKCQIP